MNRLEKKFRELKKNKKKAFVAFITAGYPDLQATYRLLLEFSKIGVDVVELGVPFTDPMADGPVIQEASQEALDKGINLEKIFALVKKARASTEMPICLMTYYNPVFCMGEERFVGRAVKSGVDGLIVPDLPPEEAKGLIKQAKSAGLDTIFFVSPTSSLARAKFCANASTGFIYYVSLTGTTGERKKLPSDIARNIRQVKKLTAKPVCAGFGISNARQVKEVLKDADGVIVGSAIVKRIKENKSRPDLIKRVVKFVAELKNV